MPRYWSKRGTDNPMARLVLPRCDTGAGVERSGKRVRFEPVVGCSGAVASSAGRLCCWQGMGEESGAGSDPAPLNSFPVADAR